MNRTALPVKQDLSQSYTLTLSVAILMTLASLAGILFQSVLYQTDELRRSFVANDVVNLLLGLPFLVGSMWFARRGKLLGLLLWPGALFYVVYNYTAYAVAMSRTILVLPCVILVVLAAYTIIRLLQGMDRASIRNLLKGAVPERFAGGVLIGFGALFFLRSISQVVGMLTGQITLEGAELGVLTADLLATPLWMMGGITLWQKRALGYASGVGLLFQTSMLFVGLLIFFILQPFLSSIPFRMADFVVILVMGLVCFVPFGMFVHRVMRGAS